MLGLDARIATQVADFPLLVPLSYVNRMRPGDADDPLLRQVLPVAEELGRAEGFLTDPVGDAAASLAPGLLQKYHGRALLVATGSCAVHCRYCFRRNYPYATAVASPRHLDEALAQIADDPTLSEVILSGGDPLLLDDTRLAGLVQRIESIPHVRRLRIHTRTTIVLPSRVTHRFVQLLQESRLTCVVVHHANHARELNGEVAVATRQIARTGAQQLNQAVLLRGVNDTSAAQAELSERLVEVGILPYYLHQLDKVQGATHFETPVDVGKQIVAELRRTLPGYMVPRFVREVEGATSKVMLA